VGMAHRSQLHRAARKQNGEQCRRHARRTTTCDFHGARAPQAPVLQRAATTYLTYLTCHYRHRRSAHANCSRPHHMWCQPPVQDSVKCHAMGVKVTGTHM
jgi:hypothetical protein